MGWLEKSIYFGEHMELPALNMDNADAAIDTALPGLYHTFSGITAGRAKKERNILWLPMLPPKNPNLPAGCWA